MTCKRFPQFPPTATGAEIGLWRLLWEADDCCRLRGAPDASDKALGEVYSLTESGVDACGMFTPFGCVRSMIGAPGRIVHLYGANENMMYGVSLAWNCEEAGLYGIALPPWICSPCERSIRMFGSALTVFK